MKNYTKIFWPGLVAKCSTFKVVHWKWYIGSGTLEVVHWKWYIGSDTLEVVH